MNKYKSNVGNTLKLKKLGKKVMKIRPWLVANHTCWFVVQCLLEHLATIKCKSLGVYLDPK